jgi:hydroxymethylglutaryl-CoA synthase
VGAGKYTIGLGQLNLSIASDREDVASISLTSLKNLMEKNDIHPTQIGRLEVGTETLLDKAKSLKTVLMSFF